MKAGRGLPLVLAMVPVAIVACDWHSQLPRPIFDEKPELVDLYYKAWEIAHTRIDEIPGLPAPRYMDEAKIDEWAPLAHMTNAIPPIFSICGQPPYEWKCRAEENRLMIASLVALGHRKAYFAELPGCTHGGTAGACGPYIRDFIRGEYTPAKHK